MTPAEFLNGIIDPGLDILAMLGGPRPSDEARQMLLTIAQQESGPALNARYQGSPSSSPGPARGWWQFEQGGGVRGVLNHAASSDLAEVLCGHCHVQVNEGAVWRALEGHDMLAAGFARLLLWTDPYAIPTDPEGGWVCYADRLWRPGEPHPEVWPGNWITAQEAVSSRFTGGVTS